MIKEENWLVSDMINKCELMDRIYTNLVLNRLVNILGKIGRAYSKIIEYDKE